MGGTIYYRIGNRIFRRDGECNRCGFCCRKDIVNLRAYRDRNRRFLNRFKTMLAGDCDAMKRDLEGKLICTFFNDEKRGKGCWLFPWHPDQLDNVERDDLPRMPEFNIGYSPIVRSQEVILEDGRKIYFQTFEDQNLKRSDLKIIGWKPLSTVCSFRFIDVTDEINAKDLEKRPKIRPEISPVVCYGDMFSDGWEL